MIRKTKRKSTLNNCFSLKKILKLEENTKTQMKYSLTKNENQMQRLPDFKMKSNNKSLRLQSWPSTKRPSSKKKLNTGVTLIYMNNSSISSKSNVNTTSKRKKLYKNSAKDYKRQHLSTKSLELMRLMKQLQLGD